MPNPFFQFKKFTVYQDQCAMKVCTDACIMGAYIASNSTVWGVKRAIDIGAGTGLLSLMLAQQNLQAYIDAVELDNAASQQCARNIAQSPWAENIQVYHGNIQSFAAEAATPYDLVFSNPPFYPNHLHSPDVSRNQALHTVSLDFSELAHCTQRLMKEDGYACFLIPTGQEALFTEKLAAYRLFPVKKLYIKDQVHRPDIRVVLVCRSEAVASPETDSLVIRTEDGSYAEGFVDLMRHYYTIL